MPSKPDHIQAYLDRLRTVKEYADSEGISVVQAHRRIVDGKAETVTIRKRVFVVLPA